MTKINLPVLKAWGRLFELLECIYNHPYDRNGFQKAVMDLYPGKSPKSVFRGMAIPTLRNLGLIVGYGDVIRISANGALLHITYNEVESEGLRALRVILVELDNNIGLLLFLENKGTITIQDLVKVLGPNLDISDPRATRKTEGFKRAVQERIRDWVGLLSFAKLLSSDGHNVLIDTDILVSARSDINTLDKYQCFIEFFFVSYKHIVTEQKGVRTVEIEKLRKTLAIYVYNQSRHFITEKMFDKLLMQIPKTSNQYTITFGRSIGADEKLFSFQGKYYQTVFVRFYE